MNISWRDYERAMFNDLYYRFSYPMYTVIPNDRNVVGKYSETRRQIDVAVYEKEQMDRPFLMIECKRYKRKLNVKDVEAFIGMLDDIEPIRECLLAVSALVRLLSEEFEVQM